jgi:VanZ family protein
MNHPESTPYRRIFFWSLVVAHMGLIFFLSSFSQFPKEVPSWVFYSDKALHGLCFGFLGLLFLNAVLNGRWSEVTFAHVLGAVGFTLLYGVSDEIHQMFVPGRQPSVGDIVADTVGAFVMCFLFFCFFHRPKLSALDL